MSLFPIGFRDQLHMTTLANELKEIPVVKESVQTFVTPRQRRLAAEAAQRVISGRCPIPTFLEVERPRLPAAQVPRVGRNCT
jgi:hypothetical protein